MRMSSLCKRLTAVALSVVMAVSLLPLSASAAGNVNPGSYLSSSAYYGNKSKCKMDAAMAYGYAQALNGMNGSQHKAKLVDVAGDGMPLLATVTEYGVDNIQNFRLWTWNGTSAKAYNFVKDAEMGRVFSYTIGSYSGTPVIRVLDGEVDESEYATFGHIYYQVNQAQISIRHHEMSYAMEVRNGRANGSSVSSLVQAGWLYDGDGYYGGLYREKRDGKYLSFRDMSDFWSYKAQQDAAFQWADEQIYWESTGGNELAGSWSTASSLRSSLLAYVEATGDFVDVASTNYAYQPVVWAVKEGITNGTSATTFSPDQTCTQGQILTFLWRAMGQPKAGIANPFTNSAVTSGQYYYDALLWAYEQGLISDKGLDPNAGCKRSDVVLYLWRLAGSPAVGGSSFTDVSSSAPYAAAVAWAVRENITTGTTPTTFAPNQTCTRAQIVTFLYRDLA